MSVGPLFLRLVAVLGPLAVLAWEVASLPPLKPRQEWGLAVLFFAGLLVLLFLALVAPRASGALLRHPDLLVPLGVTFTLGAAVNGLASLSELASFAAPVWQGNVLRLSLALSAPLLVSIFLAVLHAGWTTSLVLQAVEHGSVELCAPLAHPARWFLRALGVLAIGTAGLLLLLVVGLALAAVALPLGLIFLAMGSLVWNLFTAALLLTALRSRSPFPRALGEGLGASLQGMGRWWGVVVLQMFLLGWVTFLHVRYTSSEAGRSTSHSKTNWSVNAFWTGGYEEGCRWYGQAMQLAAAAPLPPLVLLLALLFGVVAVAVKLTVAQRMEWQVEEEDELAPPRKASRAGPAVLAAVIGGALVALCGGLLFRAPVTDALFKREFRRAVERGESPEALRARLAGREDGLKQAAQFRQDADPRVRKAILGYLVGGAPLAPKEGPETGAFVRSWSGGYPGDAVSILKQLLADSDPEVRLETIRAVAGRRDADHHFREPLLELLRSGTVEDRVAVAESLAHWDAGAFLETFTDQAQPKEVRLAVLRGGEHYGWGKVYDTRGLAKTLKRKRTLDEPDRDLRHAAIDALRHASEGGPALWLEVLSRPAEDDRQVAFRTWVGALAGEPSYPGERYPLLEQTEALVWAFRKDGGGLDGERVALVLHVLCAAARESAARLDRAQPANLGLAMHQRARGGGPAAAAFVQELHRLQLILRALAGVRQFAADPRSGKTDFLAKMPDEEFPAKPRKLRGFLLEQAKEPLAWCRRNGTRYGSPFLRVNGFWFAGADPGPRPGQSRTLGQVLQAMQMHTDEALARYLKKQAKE